MSWNGFASEYYYKSRNRDGLEIPDRNSRVFVFGCDQSIKLVQINAETTSLILKKKHF